MTVRTSCAAALLAAAAVTATLPAPATAAPVPATRAAYTTGAATGGWTAATYAARVTALVNAERVRTGRRPLALSGCAAGFARTWSAVLARRGALAHQDLGRVLRSCGHTRSGENVAFTSGTPEQVVRMWMASPGHRANLLSTGFTHVGTGVTRDARGRWFSVQVFARG